MRDDDDDDSAEVLQRFQMHPPHRCISRQERKILKKDEQFQTTAKQPHACVQ
jgi:hypothetical protein